MENGKCGLNVYTCMPYSVKMWQGFILGQLKTPIIMYGDVQPVVCHQSTIFAWFPNFGINVVYMFISQCHVLFPALSSHNLNLPLYPQMILSGPLKPRWGHTITAFSLGPKLTEVTAFGGTALPWKGGEDKQPKLAETTLLQFGEYSS